LLIDDLHICGINDYEMFNEMDINRCNYILFNDFAEWASKTYFVENKSLAIKLNLQN
jgi:hypothetical protein